MKYVRTKDGRIYEVAHGIKRYGHENSVLVFIDGFLVDVYEMGIIERQAEAIEDLCDEFVGVDNDNVRNAQFMKPFDYYMRSLNPKDVSLYGAIWTDKGLIYVSKINEEGRWELL